MKFRNQFLKYHVYHNQAGFDGDDAGSAGKQDDEQGKTFTQEEVNKMIAEQVAGLKGKNSELIGEQKKLKESLAKFDGIDPDAVRTILNNFADQEEAKLIADGKIDEVLQKRTERMKANHDKELAKLQGDLEKQQTRLAKFADRALNAAVREVGADLSIHKSAYDDAMLRAKAMFDVDDDGNAVAKDGVFGKDGKPLTLKEWFTDMKETAPHWFPAPSGSGSQNGGGGLGGAPKSLAECKTDAERVAYLQSKIQ